MYGIRELQNYRINFSCLHIILNLTVMW